MSDNSSGSITSVERLLESNLESVDIGEALVLDAARSAGLEEEAQHKLGMAVRESLVNAVVHGNRYSARKKVFLAVSVNRERLAVTVGDEGEGFDPATLPDPLAEENLLRQSGRGLLLIQAFVDEFEIRRREPRGTHVHLVKRLAPT
jgi:serine/threonine-protein kinase RsbW